MPCIQYCICSTQNLWGNYVNLLLQIKEWGLERWARAQHCTGNSIRARPVYLQSPWTRWMATKTWLVHREIHLTYLSQSWKFLLNFSTSHSHSPENAKWLTEVNCSLAFCYLKHSDTAGVLVVLRLLLISQNAPCVLNTKKTHTELARKKALPLHALSWI